MSPRLRAALYAQAGAVFSLHPCLYAGDRPTAGRSRFATLLPGDAAVSPSNGDHAGTQRADPPPPRNGPKHRGAGRSRSATGPPRQSRSTRQFFCAEVLAVSVHRDQGAESARLRRFGTGSSTIDSGPSPPRRAFVRRNRPFRLRCSGTVTFNAGSASGPVVTRAFGGVHAYKTTRWRELRARRPLSSGGGAAVSFPCLAPFRSLPRPWPRPRSLQIKPTSR